MRREDRLREEYIKKLYYDRTEKRDEYYSYSMTDFTKIICGMTFVNIVFVSFTILYSISSSLLEALYFTCYIGVPFLIVISYYWYKHKLKREKRAIYDRKIENSLIYVNNTRNLEREMIERELERLENQYNSDITEHENNHKIFYFFDKDVIIASTREENEDR